MDAKNASEMRDYAWKYFALHSDQRMKAFNFFLLLVTVIIGGILAYLNDATRPGYVCPVGLLLAVISFVFWKLDIRTKQLIKHAEDALKTIEIGPGQDDVPDALKLFSHEKAKTDKIRVEQRLAWRPSSWSAGFFSYSTCFNTMFLVFGSFGIAIAITSLFLPSVETAPKSSMPTQQFFIEAGHSSTPQ